MNSSWNDTKSFEEATMTMARLPRPNSRTTAGRSGRHLRVWTALYEKRVKARLLSRRYGFCIHTHCGIITHAAVLARIPRKAACSPPHPWREGGGGKMRRAFFGRTDGIAAKTAGGGVPRIDGGIKMEFRRPRHRGAHHHPGSTPMTRSCLLRFENPA